MNLGAGCLVLPTVTPWSRVSEASRLYWYQSILLWIYSTFILRQERSAYPKGHFTVEPLTRIEMQIREDIWHLSFFKNLELFYGTSS